MPTVELSRQADRDFQSIAEYTQKNFDREQYRRYRNGLVKCAQGLAEQPLLGRSAEQHGPELRRFEYKSHVLIFRPTADGVRIERILHLRMDVFRHLES